MKERGGGWVGWLWVGGGVGFSFGWVVGVVRECVGERMVGGDLRSDGIGLRVGVEVFGVDVKRGELREYVMRNGIREKGEGGVEG